MVFYRKSTYFENLNFELALNNSVIMLPTKNYVDQPKTKSAIVLTKIGFFVNAIALLVFGRSM
jgi:hypothetical protein